jgi:drug/metabolite transporter (DMT)-like permease
MFKLKLLPTSKGYLLVAISGGFFGLSGMFVEILSAYNIPINLLGFYRPLIAFIMIFIYLLIRKREYLKVDGRGLLYIALLGFVSQTLFNQLYFATMEKTTIATAVVLLYTAPIFVVIMARFLYKELFNLPKLIALVVSVTGCFLAATGGSFELLKLNSTGLLLGVGTGFTFALLPIISKDLVKKYHYFTIALYSMGFGALFSLAFIDIRTIILIDYNIKIWANLIALGFFANAFAYLLYMAGMSYNIQSSKVSIINTVEVPVAVLTSFIFFQEYIFGLKLLGILLVILSVVIIEYGEQLFLVGSERGQDQV